MEQIIIQIGKKGLFKIFDKQIVMGIEDVTINLLFANKSWKTLNGAKKALSTIKGNK